MTDPDSAGLQSAVADALLSAIARDTDRLGEALYEIVAMGNAATYAALCAWAEAASRGLARGQPPGDYWGLEIQDAEGREKSLDDLDDPPARDALRIMTCWANGDHDTVDAIFKVACDDVAHLSALLVRSVMLAAVVAKAMAEEQ